MNNLTYLSEESGDSSKKIFDFIHSQENSIRYRTDSKYFTRSSPLDFASIVNAILGLFKNSVEFDVHRLFSDQEGNSVTGSAFSQARYKIKHELFKDLTDELLPFYHQSGRRLWKGHALIAGDGSTLNLPSSKTIREEYGVYSTTQEGTPTYLARVLFLYDVLDNFVLNGQISNNKKGEITLLKKALQSDIPDESIIILDRGFGYMSTILALADRGLDFAVRFSTNSLFAKSILSRNLDDQIVTWEPTMYELKKAKARKQILRPITVRVTRIQLKSGDVELVVSSLVDLEKYRYDEVKELYHYRWPVEEGFKNLKPKMKIEQFGARKPEGILQEFYAHIFIMNLIALFGQVADKQIRNKTINRKYEYKYNWQNAFRVIKSKIHELLNTVDLTCLVKWIVNSIGKFKVAIIPERSFVREPRNLQKSRKINAYYK